MSYLTTQDRQDIIRAIICLVVIIVCAILVNGGKVDVSVFLIILTGVTSYYLGKSSSQGSLKE